MIWNSQVETASRGAVADTQLERLKWVVGHAYENVSFYRDKFDAIGLRPSHIKTLKDIRHIPFTTKDDLRDHYPYGLFAAPMEKIVRLHASSGTTGKPIVVGYTRADLDNWSECIARIIGMAGGGSGDIAQIAFGYGLFTGGFGLHYGLEKVGATVVPISSGNSEMQLMLMRDFGTTLFISTPSYILYLSEYMNEVGIKMSDIKLKLGMFGGEGHTPEMRAEIERRWGIVATENYGLTEVMGPGVSGECTEFRGMHINEDHFYPEIIDANTHEPLDTVGEQGELVLTTLTKEGIPMLRYRTKDITFLDDAPCPCGRTSTRMNKVLGRTDDMLIIRGVNVFPSQIESVLMSIPHVGPHYQIIVSRKGFMDAIEVQVEPADDLLVTYGELEHLSRTVRDKLRSVLRIDSVVKLVEPKSLTRFTGKAKRVIDTRQ